MDTNGDTPNSPKLQEVVSYDLFEGIFTVSEALYALAGLMQDYEEHVKSCEAQPEDEESA